MKIPQVQTPDRLTNQLQQNIAQAIEPIFNNLSGTFTANLTGCTKTIQQTASWEVATATGPVCLVFPEILGTSNSTSATITGLPKNLWPISEQVVIIIIEDNGSITTGKAHITPEGVINLYATVGGGGFTSSGIKGVLNCIATYPRNV